MTIVITAIGKRDNMKRFSATAIALALGVTLTGCGLIGRTVLDGFYGEPNTQPKIRPTSPSGRVQYHKE